MTTSTNALLYYGFTFLDEDEDEPPWNIEGDDIDSDEWLCNKLGGPKEPDVTFCHDTKPQYSEYWAAKKKFIDELPIIIDAHCYIDSPMWFICFRRSHHSASRGYPTQLGDSIIAFADWAKTLKEYCEKLGIEWQKPQWELAPMWS